MITFQVFQNETHQKYRSPAAVPSRQTELIIDQLVPVKKPDVNSEQVALIVPTDLPNESTQEEVQTRVVEHSLDNLLKGKFIKNPELAKSAAKVQEAMKPGVSFGDPNGVQHKVDLEVEAVSNVATLNYSGLVNSTVKYSHRAESVNLSLEEQLSQRTRVSVEHDTKDEKSTLNFNIDW